MLLYGKEIPTHAGAIVANQRDAGKRDDAKQVEDAFGWAGIGWNMGYWNGNARKKGKGYQSHEGSSRKRLAEYKYENKRLRMENEWGQA